MHHSNLARSWLVTLLLVAIAPFASGRAQGLGVQPVPAERVELESAAWSARIETICTVVLPELADELEARGALENFRVAAGAPGEHSGEREADAEVYRWLEAVALTLRVAPGDALRARAVAVVELVASAQQDDGYLNTWIQVERPERRFRELKQSLELHSLGHLIRAGLAWRDTTGDESLHRCGLRAAKLVVERFGPGKLLDPPGFSAIEEALLALADDTGDETWAELALFFIEQRGDERRRKRYGPEYQDDLPVLEERLAVGHAERGLALYRAIAEVARTRGYQDYWTAAQALWDDIARRKMYVTGGVGALAFTEGFGLPHELFPESAFCATGAAASMLELNQSLLLRTGHAVGADLVELELYNALLAGMSLDGKAFFHDNPLVSLGGTQRVERPRTTRGVTALARAVASVGGLVYAHEGDDLYLAQYIACSARVPLAGGEVLVRMETDYPTSGLVRLVLDPPRLMTFNLHVRVPGWCTDAVTLGPNEVQRDIKVTHGHDAGTWLEFEREWSPGDTFTLRLPMNAQAIPPRRKVAAHQGRVALRRGPEVYCVEAADNGGSVFDLFVPRSAELSTRWEPEVLGGVHLVEARGGRLVMGQQGAALEPARVTAVPYRLWGNRGPGAMNLWLAATPELAELPGETGVVFENGHLVQASHVSRHTTLRALCDGVLPRDSRDELIPRATFEEHRGTEEWLRYDFETTRLFDGASVYWFDQGEGGACRVPASWRVQWLQGERWRDVQPTTPYGVERDRSNDVNFQRVATRALRIVVQLERGASAGVLEWTVKGPGDDSR